MVTGLYVWNGSYDIIYGISSYQWPTTIATVSSCNVTYKNDRHGIGYNSNVKYTYEVHNILYQGSNIEFGNKLRLKVPDIRYKFKTNSSVTVAYMPSNPSLSVIIPGITISATWKYFLSLIFLFASLIYLVSLNYAGDKFTSQIDTLISKIIRSYFTKKILLKGVPLIFFCIGCIRLNQSIPTMYYSYQCQHWPKAEGSMILSRMHYHKSKRSHNAYTVDIIYDFVVMNENNSESYNGHQLHFGPLKYYSKSKAQQLITTYNTGKKFDVFYYPKDPNISVIIPDFHISILLSQLPSLLFIFVGLLLLTLPEQYFYLKRYYYDSTGSDAEKSL